MAGQGWAGWAGLGWSGQRWGWSIQRWGGQHDSVGVVRTAFGWNGQGWDRQGRVQVTLPPVCGWHDYVIDSSFFLFCF